LGLSQQVQVFLHLAYYFAQIFKNTGYLLLFTGHKVRYLLHLIFRKEFLVPKLVQGEVVQQHIQGVFKVRL
jgi:hypothetical protein